MMKVLEGELVRIRPVKDDDLGYLAGLKNNLMTQGWNQRLPPNVTAEKIGKRFRETNEKPNRAILAMETLDGPLLGNINYHEETPRHDASIGIVMGTEFWGKGYAHEAQELLLHFLFVERNIAVVRLWTQPGFPWAQKAAEKLGFKVSVRFRENTIIDGKVVDSLCMDMLREEYFQDRQLEDKAGKP